MPTVNLKFPIEYVKDALDTDHVITGNPEIDSQTVAFIVYIKRFGKVTMPFARSKIVSCYESAVSVGKEFVVIPFEFPDEAELKQLGWKREGDFLVPDTTEQES